jgi:hypothetical protein
VLEEEVREIAVPQEMRGELIEMTKESRKSSMVETPKLGGTKVEFPLAEDGEEVDDWPQYLSEEEVR